MDKTLKKYIITGVSILVAAIVTVLFVVVSNAKDKANEPLETEVEYTENGIPINNRDEEYKSFGADKYEANIITYKGESGTEYSFGTDFVSIDKEIEAAFLSLDPKATNTKNKVGFQFEPTIGDITNSNKDVKNTNELDSDKTSFQITEWNENKIASAAYTDEENAGVYWFVDNQGMELTDEQKENMVIYVRAVDLTNNHMLDVFKICVEITEDGKYKLTKAETCELESGGAISRDDLIFTALDEYKTNRGVFTDMISSDGTEQRILSDWTDQILAAKRYTVELLEYQAYSPFVLFGNRQTGESEVKTIAYSAYPIIAITPCYTDEKAEGNKKTDLITVYLAPMYLHGGRGINYLGYTDWANGECIFK